jgi:adenine phosphoribosyltransferase
MSAEILEQKIKQAIRDIPDYPKPGILFKDITPLLSNASLIREITHNLSRYFSGQQIEAIVGVEARGFILGSILAYEMQVPFIPVRKKGKLPYKTISESYALEYGQAEIEIHADALRRGMRVLIHDDILATGGTAGAAGNLVKKLGAEIAAFSFLINLSFLPGEINLTTAFGVKPHYLVSY